ncbi:MAG: hypothetical protein Kow0059_14750 [Candidatus Sumerlaeia bacterium]
MFLILILLGVWILLIYYFGTSPFGRSGTQNWIEAFRDNEKVYDFLNSHHGFFRAAFHYVQFGGLYYLLYLTINGGSFHWATGRAWLALVLSCVGAYLDEWHQSRQAGRCARKIDLLHSCLGASYAHIFLGLMNLIF